VAVFCIFVENPNLGDGSITDLETQTRWECEKDEDGDDGARHDVRFLVFAF
jgi:hypothetical protein